MKTIRYEYLKSSLSVFPFSSLQEFVTILRSLHEYSIDMMELVDYVIENQKVFAEETAKGNISRIATRKYFICPECGALLRGDQLNNSPNSVLEEPDEEGRMYLSLATCMNERDCGWQKFSHLNLNNLIRSFFPSKVNESLEELTRQPHGMEDI